MNGNIVWSPERGWHNGDRAAVTLDNGHLVTTPNPDADDLAFARDTLGPDASDDDVQELAEQRVSVRITESARNA